MLSLDEKKEKGKKGVMDLKLDMPKTCDMIEWSFVTRVLEAMGFSKALVHYKFSSVSY